MVYPMLGEVDSIDLELTDEEMTCWKAIHAYLVSVNNSRGDTGEFLRDGIGKIQWSLTVSLRDRSAIPRNRLNWLFDSKYTIGWSESRYDVLRKGWKTEDKVYQAPQWGRSYLPFLLGIIELPAGVIDSFRQDAAKNMMDAYEMGQIYRKVAKDHGLEKRDTEEFYKLAVDCGYNHGNCRTIRDAIHHYLRK